MAIMHQQELSPLCLVNLCRCRWYAPINACAVDNISLFFIIFCSPMADFKFFSKIGAKIVE